MGNKRVKLGRNLSALLDQNQSSVNETTETTAVQHCSIDRLSRGDYQPRSQFDEVALQELAESIRAQGMIQPIVVRQRGEGYEILAGERRWRAAQQAGLTDVPIIVREMDDQSALALALIENIQREDLGVLEQARALARLVEEFALTHQQIATLIGKNRTTVSNLLRLLSLPDAVLAYLDARQIEMGHARALLSLTPDEQIAIAQRIVQRGLTVRATEHLVQHLRQKDDNLLSVRSKPAISEELRQLQLQISQSLKRAVQIQPAKSGCGKITIGYKNLDDLRTLEMVLTEVATKTLDSLLFE